MHDWKDEFQWTEGENNRSLGIRKAEGQNLVDIILDDGADEVFMQMDIDAIENLIELATAMKEVLNENS